MPSPVRGVKPSNELFALTIGSYVCQALAANQSDQAVWDFVVPMVRGDVRDAQTGESTPPVGQVNSVTARLHSHRHRTTLLVRTSWPTPAAARGTVSLPWALHCRWPCWSGSPSSSCGSGCGSPTCDRDPAEHRAPDDHDRPSGAPASPSKPRPEFQDASCPDVMVLSIPGTWESSPQLDPANPVQFPIALLLNVTNPLRQAFGEDRMAEYTVPYTAQFHNPFSADNQISYDDSRAEGTRASVKALTDMNNRCPLTSYVIVGFSQGAVIAGDLASDIGNGRGPVDADLVLGVDAHRGRKAGEGRWAGHRPQSRGAGRRDHAQGHAPWNVRPVDERASPRRFRHAERPHQPDLRQGRSDLLRAPGRVLDHEPAQDRGHPHRGSGCGRTRARAVQHTRVLGAGRCPGSTMDAWGGRNAWSTEPRTRNTGESIWPSEGVRLTLRDN